jgi:hypothetical protein
LIVGYDAMVDDFDQFFHAFENVTSNPFPGYFPKPPLNPIQPRRTGGNSMQVESLVPLNPLFDLGLLVVGIVVHDPMQVHSFRGVSVHLSEKLEKFLVPVALKA